MHTRERQRDQLVMTGLAEFPTPETGWLLQQGAVEPARPPYVILVPGAARHRPTKRWPAERYAELARHLRRLSLTPIVVGDRVERDIAAAIPEALDLTGGTTLFDLALLARNAAFAVGNDTGPMHVAATVGCRCIVLFSAESDPALTAPRGPDGEWPAILRRPDLRDLTLEEVVAALP